MRALAITGIVTVSWISRILVGSAMRATPPSDRMSAGTRSSAITAQAPASSAIRACSAVVTSMITPPFSISARPLLTLIVPMSLMASILALPFETVEDLVVILLRRRHRPEDHGVLLDLHHVADVRPELLGRELPVELRDVFRLAVVVAERDRDGVTGLEGADRAQRRGVGDQ